MTVPAGLGGQRPGRARGSGIQWHLNVQTVCTREEELRERLGGNSSTCSVNRLALPFIGTRSAVLPMRVMHIDNEGGAVSTAEMPARRLLEAQGKRRRQQTHEMDSVAFSAR